MKYKINLHAHSKYSDGSNSLEEMVLKSIELGLCACVLTDHSYINYNHYSLTPEKFRAELDEAKVLMEKYRYPIIIGTEVSIGRMEECCVFGAQAIFSILDIIETRALSFEDMIKIKSLYGAAVNLCHPMKPQEFADEGAAEFLDGYEYIHSGVNEFDHHKWTREIPKQFEGLLKLCNSDAHCAGSLETCWNEVDEFITNELELIDYLNKRKPVSHYNMHEEVVSPDGIILNLR